MILVLVVATVVLGLPATLGSLLRPGSDVTMRLGKIWSSLVLAATGTHPTYHGTENVRKYLPCVYISNHLSNLDIWAITPMLPDETRFVAKRSIFWIPFLGWALAAAGFIPIDRKNRSQAIRSLSRASGRIRAGRPVILFAEGTRSRDGRLGPFKKGAFRLALEAGVPVVPVAISGSGHVLRPGSLRVRSGPVRVSFAPPIHVRPYQPHDTAGLMAAVRRAIVERLDPSEVGGAADIFAAQIT